MRRFNTSGPNYPEEHYTIFRKDAIEQGRTLVYRKSYFTVWAPRQTGKSTWLRQLAVELEKEGTFHFNGVEVHTFLVIYDEVKDFD